ncbi:MAG: hypothetical protein GYB66_12745, partial [Chloroflexi bacterium]|nr:hypothetical protein [Chloroflexota bacterium]
LEFIRIEIPEVGGVNVSQVTTGLIVLVAVSILVLRHRSDNLVTETYPPYGEPPAAKKKRKSSSGRGKSSTKSGKSSRKLKKKSRP